MDTNLHKITRIWVCLIVLLLSSCAVLGQSVEELKAQMKMKRDSFMAVAARMHYERALERLDSYKQNTRKDTVAHLDLSGARLQEIPNFAFDFKNLKSIDLSENKIVRYKSLKQFGKLEKLVLKESELQSRVRIPKVKSLKSITLYNNEMETIPRSLRKLKTLESLYVGNNQIKTVPRWIKRMKSLQLLSLDSNPLDMTSIKFEKLPESLVKLHLNDCNLSMITPSLYGLPIVELQLRENQLEQLPEGISKMTQLRKLSLYKNKLTSLPSDFFELRKLTALDLYYNELKTIPDGIQQFDSLQILFLSHNQLEVVPKEIGQMSQLRELYLHHNQLKVIPDEYNNLYNLTAFRINDNQFTEFPIAIFGMQSLEFLDVSENLLEGLPDELLQLRKLTLFTYNDNLIDFHDPANQNIPYLIERMMESGTQCIPEINRVVDQ